MRLIYRGGFSVFCFGSAFKTSAIAVSVTSAKMFGGGGFQQSVNNKVNNTTGYQNDIPIPASSCPKDSISCLDITSDSFSSDIVAASSWDGTVRIWNVPRESLQPNPIGVFQDKKPLLCTCFSSGREVFFGGLDNDVKCLPVDNQTVPIVVAKHEKPVKSVKYHSGSGFSNSLLVSGSWDGTVKFNDIRTPPDQPVHTMELGAKVICMDIYGNVMVVVTTDRLVQTFDISDLKGNGPRVMNSSSSSLEYQYRSVALISEEVYALGSIEGRTTIKYVNNESKSFTFKCHRNNVGNEIHASQVNAVARHPQGTFATAGGDGAFTFWDYNKKQRLKQFEKASDDILSCKFNDTGEMFVYAVGYDWSRGPKQDTSTGNCIYIHRVDSNHVRPR